MAKAILFFLQIPAKAERQLTSSTYKKKKHFSEIKFGIKGGGGIKAIDPVALSNGVDSLISLKL
ncbi:MAG: hypothetical protein WCK78_14985 [Paludibacter sp.]